MTIETLPLETIRTDGGTQPRATLDPATIQNYAEAMSRGETFPPVIVFHDGTHYWLADGFHRLAAAKESDPHPDPDLDCEIRQGTQRDAVLFSAGANATHGLPRSNEDKRRAVERVLSDDEWRTWSDRQIAEACKVSHPFVGKVRADLFGDDVSDERTYTRKGTVSTMLTGNISSKGASHGEKEAESSPTEPDLPDLEPLILAALDAGPKRLTQLLVLARQAVGGPKGPPISEALSETLDRLVDDGTITRKHGQGTGKAIEYETNVIKTSNGGENGAPSLDDLRDRIVGWLNTQKTSQRPFWIAEMRKGIGLKPAHDARFGQALDQLVERGVLQRFPSGQYHFAEFERPDPHSGTIPVIAIMKNDPARAWPFDTLVELTGLSDHGVKTELANGRAYGAVRELPDGTWQLASADAKRAQKAAAESVEPAIDQVDPVTAEVTQITPERDPDPDRPVDPVHMTRPLLAGGEFGYLDQRPIRVVLNVIAELEAIEDALKAVEEQEFALALAHNAEYPTARQIKKADEVALRVCGQIARLDVLCAQFKQQQAAQKAEPESSAESTTDATAAPVQQPEAVD